MTFEIEKNIILTKDSNEGKTVLNFENGTQYSHYYSLYSKSFSFSIPHTSFIYAWHLYEEVSRCWRRSHDHLPAPAPMTEVYDAVDVDEDVNVGCVEASVSLAAACAAACSDCA